MNRLDDLQTDAFAARARAALDSSAEHLDFATLSKLNQARQRALEHSSEKSRATRWWLGLGSILGTATAAALVLAVYLHPYTPITSLLRVPARTDSGLSA